MTTREQLIAWARKEFGVSNGTQTWIEFQGSAESLADAILAANVIPAPAQVVTAEQEVSVRPTIQLPGPIRQERFRYPFTVQWAAGSEVPVGENLVPEVVYLTADAPPHSDRPAVTVRYQVIGGVVRCTGFDFWTERPEQSVRMRDMEWVVNHWDQIRAEALSACMLEPDGSGGWIMPADRERMRRKARSLPKPPRSNRSLSDPAFIKRVASTYNDNPTGGVEAVMDAFDIGRAMAQRYVKAAREAGLVEDRRRNRTSAKEEGSNG
jgi:hypothetical protein